MAEADNSNTLSDCAICLEIIKSPRRLPCSHIFCEVCISEYIVSTVDDPEQKTFNCPVCRMCIQTKNSTKNKSYWVYDFPECLTGSNTQNTTRTQDCHACKRFGSNKEAIVWCCECLEALCQNCSSAHSRLKQSLTHKTVAIEEQNYASFSLLQETDDYCSIHETKRLEVYCFDHSKPCCVSCLNLDHRKCENVQNIDDIEDLEPENIENLESELLTLRNKLKKIAEKKRESRQKLLSSFEAIQEEADSVLTSVKKRIDDLHQEFIKNSKLMQSDMLQEFGTTIKQIDEESEAIDKWLEHLQLMKNFGSKQQTFLAIQKIKTNADENFKHIESTLDEAPDVKLQAGFEKLTDTLCQIDAFGRISISRRGKESICFRALSKIFKLENSFESINLKNLSFKELKCGPIKCGVSIDENRCAILVHGRLELFSIVSGIKLAYAAIENNPKKVCFKSSITTFFITCNSKIGYTCNLQNDVIKNVQSHTFQNKVCGIDKSDDVIYIAMSGGILQSETFENHRVLISNHIIDGYRDDIAVHTKSARFAIINYQSKQLNFMTFQEAKPRTFLQNDKIWEPRSITFGLSGKLFVAGKSVVYVISQDEKRFRTILSKFEKIQDIDCIWTNAAKNRLFVGGNGYIEIYEID
ncbi:transcription intermediary factor 1-beta-like [Mytilus californianus]|uniref:transcription intermediary factor 1-beta-like n=1 Tax=Mytilus californianus TaxID=6549 RepID=UPI002247568A|nr:transcription intermediary factor 1-beta-like [Mytilus californianus]